MTKRSTHAFSASRSTPSIVRGPSTSAVPGSAGQRLRYRMYGNARFFLFSLGITFSAVFRLAKDIFVLGRFYILVDSLYTNVTEGLKMPLADFRHLRDFYRPRGTQGLEMA